MNLEYNKEKYSMTNKKSKQEKQKNFFLCIWNFC